jgi:hypothetical protein
MICPKDRVSCGAAADTVLAPLSPLPSASARASKIARPERMQECLLAADARKVGLNRARANKRCAAWKGRPAEDPGSSMALQKVANSNLLLTTPNITPYSTRTHPSLNRRPAALAAEFAAMPPQLTDYELETAARACRALAHVERESAEKISDPALRSPVHQRAQCAATLAERFERARKRSKA